MKVAAWIAGALALGWFTTAGVAVALPNGHPPWAFYVGGAVVLLSFVMAPIGAVAALVSVRRARGHLVVVGSVAGLAAVIKGGGPEHRASLGSKTTMEGWLC
jgi:hypothetical protein